MEVEGVPDGGSRCKESMAQDGYNSILVVYYLLSADFYLSQGSLEYQKSWTL